MQGTAAGPGVGIGVAAFRGVHDLSPDVRSIPSRGEEAEKGRLRDALVKTRNDIARLQGAAALDIDEEHALIFSSHLLLMNDPALLERMDRAITSGVSAPVAIDEALTEFEDAWARSPTPTSRSGSRTSTICAGACSATSSTRAGGRSTAGGSW